MAINSRSKIFLGGGTAAGVLIFLAIIVGVQYIALQHPKRWDLTGSGKHTLAPQSKKLMETLREKKLPVEILAFYESKDMGPRDNAKDLLDQYKDAYSDFKYSFVDPDKERTLAIQNKVEAYPTLVIKVGGKDERITTADEESLTNSVARLLRTEVKKIYLLKGHGELSPESSEVDGFNAGKAAIEKQNYKVEDLVLLQAPGVPEDASVVIVAGPKTDPLDTEIHSIKEYLNRGGHLMVLLTPFKTPKLCALLNDYGFKTADDIVVDRMSRVLGGDYLMPVITTYIKFPITKNFTLASFFPEVRSVVASRDYKPGVDVQELALTSPVSWTINEEQLNSGNANFDEKTGMKGPVSVMAASTFTAPHGKSDKEKDKQLSKEEEFTEPGSQDQKATDKGDQPKAVKSRIVVFGSSLLAANKFFKLQGNPDLFMNSVSWLAEDENLIAIRPKSTKSNPIVLTGSESWAVLLIPLLIIPFIWIGIGVVVYLYRRRTVLA
ncbi:MAG: GldG family protein [Desulfomonile tiedjei]|uniref:GldG family protein n=1 Tax=Desulfomonile tiedjei TaxID=2358 RepID=A0A9D6Z4C1_9BACT|nr:GldG family protein [Desulfomonile tiedjei]